MPCGAEEELATLVLSRTESEAGAAVTAGKKLAHGEAEPAGNIAGDTIEERLVNGKREGDDGEVVPREGKGAGGGRHAADDDAAHAAGAKNASKTRREEVLLRDGEFRGIETEVTKSRKCRVSLFAEGGFAPPVAPAPGRLEKDDIGGGAADIKTEACAHEGTHKGIRAIAELIRE